MEKASNIVTWVFGILGIVGTWIGCILGFVFAQKAGVFLWWCFLIAALITVIECLLLKFRQKAVDNHDNILAWGIITLLLISVPGGMLTLLILSERPQMYVYGNGYNPDHPKPDVKEPKIKQEKYIFTPPTPEDKLEEGSIVKVKKAVYLSAIGKRITSDDLCEVGSVSGDSVHVLVNQSNALFWADIKLDNILLRKDNPEYKPEEPAKDEPEPENEPSKDKFTEIKKYKELLDLGIITQEEFDQKKKELL